MMFVRWAFLFVLFAACSSGSEQSIGNSTWERVALEHARCFTIEQRGDERRLTVFGPGGTRDTAGQYLLSQIDAPDNLPLPLSRIAVVSTTHLSYLQALNALGVVVGAAHLDRLVDAELTAQVQGVVPEIGTANGLDRELLIVLAPEALLDYPFGQGGSTSAIHDLQRIAVTEYLEEHPLGRAEWLRFFGVLLGREQMADSLYNAIAERYKAALHPEGNARPRVFFGSSWQSRWYVPPGNSYMGQLIADAGGTYCFSSTVAGENVAMDLEQVLDETARADHFGAVLAHSGSVDPVLLAGGDRRIAGMKAVSQGGFVGNSASSDFFGRALLEPDLVLRDLRCIFHPDQCTGHVPRYFAPIAQ
jgi:iron complex transport system substrate-binding protein